MIQRFHVATFVVLSLFLVGCTPVANTGAAPAGLNTKITDLKLKTPNGSVAAKLISPLSKSGESSLHPGLLLLHEDHGLTDWEVEQGRKLAEGGYIVLAVDLYGGQKVDSVMDAHIMGRAMPEDAVMATLKAAVDALAALPEVDKSRIGVIGWDLGGGYALDIARRDSRLEACVICYGTVVTDPKLLREVHAAVLGIFAGKDEGIGVETVTAFRKALTAAGTKQEIKIFPDCPHGFMNPASPEAGGKADPQAAQAAWDAILTFLASELKKP
jgi:carboxymethylenebutenolidase